MPRLGSFGPIPAHERKQPAEREELPPEPFIVHIHEEFGQHRGAMTIAVGLIRFMKFRHVY